MNKKIMSFIIITLAFMGLFAFTLFFQGLRYELRFEHKGFQRDISIYEELGYSEKEGYTRAELQELPHQLASLPGVLQVRKLESPPRSYLWIYEITWDEPVALIRFENGTHPVTADRTILAPINPDEYTLPELSQALDEVPPFALQTLASWYEELPWLRDSIAALWFDGSLGDIIIKPRDYEVSVQLSLRTQSEMIQKMFACLAALQKDGTLMRYDQFSIYGEEIYYVLRRS